MIIYIAAGIPVVVGRKLRKAPSTIDEQFPALDRELPPQLSNG